MQGNRANQWISILTSWINIIFLLFIIVARLSLPIGETTRERGKEEKKEVIKQKKEKKNLLCYYKVIRKEEGNAYPRTRIIWLDHLPCDHKLNCQWQFWWPNSSETWWELLIFGHRLKWFSYYYTWCLFRAVNKGW